MKGLSALQHSVQVQPNVASHLFPFHLKYCVLFIFIHPFTSKEAITITNPQQWSWLIQPCCFNPSSSSSSCCHICLRVVLNTKSKPSFSSSPPSLPFILHLTPWIHGTPVLLIVVYGIRSLVVLLQIQIQLQVL